VPDPARRSIDIDMEYMLGRFDPRGHRTRGRSEAARSTGATLRISDAERNEVADRLSRHFADGRLDESEFTERLESAMSAKTQGELSGLFDDLPSLEPPSPPSRRRRLVPILLTTTLLTVAFLALAAGSVRHVGHVPWLLLGVVVFFLWARAGRRHRSFHHSHGNQPYR